MPRSESSWLARYQPWRRLAEPGFWVAVLAVQMVFNSIVTLIDLRRFDPGFPYGHPLLWEFSSALVVGALIPLLVAFERRFPLRWGTLRAHLPWHLLGTALFCVIHVAGMVLLRKLFYGLAGESYHVRSWTAMLGYEYLKDARSYLMILAAVWSYRLILLRMQGEARVLDAAEPPAAGPGPAAPAEPVAPAAPARPERFLVRKLRKEFLIAAADIEWLQAAGNYVNLRVRGHDYPLRSTIAGVEAKLDPQRFARIHRSYLVNLDQVVSIEPLESGDARLHLKDGTVLPCSRRHRSELRGRVGSD